MIGVFDESGVEFHAATLEGALVFGNVLPCLHGFVARGEFGAGRDDAHFKLPFVNALPVSVPAVVKLSFVFIRPLRPDVVRAVDGTGCPIHDEGFVGRVGLTVVEPGERLIGHVHGEVVFLVMRRLDGVEVFDEAWLPLRGLPGEEAVEVIEAVAGRPAVHRTHGGGLGGGGVVPFAEGGGLVAVVAEDFREGGGLVGDDACEAVKGDGALRDGAGADAGVIAPGEERSAGRRANRRGVKGIVANALVGEFRESRRVDFATEGFSHAKADVID